MGAKFKKIVLFMEFSAPRLSIWKHQKMTFGFVECGSLAAWIVFVFMHMGPRPEKTEKTEKTEKKRDTLKYMMRHMLRIVMGALLVVSIYYFTHDGAAADSWQIITGFTLFVVHVLLAGMMYYMYDTARTAAFGVYLALVMATAGVMFVPMCVDPPGSLWVINVACFAVYTVLLVAEAAYKVYRLMHGQNKKSNNNNNNNGMMTSGDLRRSLMQQPKEY
jgi:hypothetical protein